MTNEAIIMEKSLLLMKAGVIKTEGFETITSADGTIKTLPMPEEIHTYAKWRSLGYQVKKGQKAVANFPIWAYSKIKKANDDDPDADEQVNMFLKNSSFFSKSQVEKIQ